MNSSILRKKICLYSISHYDYFWQTLEREKSKAVWIAGRRLRQEQRWPLSWGHLGAGLSSAVFSVWRETVSETHALSCPGHGSSDATAARKWPCPQNLRLLNWSRQHEEYISNFISGPFLTGRFFLSTLCNGSDTGRRCECWFYHILLGLLRMQG